MTTYQDIEKAIQSAIDAWSDCDWTHEARDAGGDLHDEHDVPVYCSGGVDGCIYCVEATEAAGSAQAEGEEALEALERDDLGAVREHVRAAAYLEREWGDAPAWGPVERLLNGTRNT